MATTPQLFVPTKSKQFALKYAKQKTGWQHPVARKVDGGFIVCPS